MIKMSQFCNQFGAWCFVRNSRTLTYEKKSVVTILDKDIEEKRELLNMKVKHES